MSVVLLTIFTISLIVILAGFWLSSRSHGSSIGALPYSGGYNVRERRASAYRRLRTRELPREAARRTQAERATALYWRGFFADRAISRALGAFVILVVLFCMGILLLRSLLPGNQTSLQYVWPDAAASQPAPAHARTSTISSPVFASLAGASKALVRINQLDPAQYSSAQEYDTWAYSTCSAAAMTEVINAYGHHYRVSDILKVEAGLHEITPELGLLEPVGIDRTVAHFNFQALWLHNPSLDDIITVANHGHPVIVDFPPARWSGGHILVVRGGDSNNVYTADSSSLNIQTFTRQNFMKYWGGFAVVVVPK
ncbi:MAG TPA: C39 family peptidase [Ktedonobacteraceae bacterium]|jgi:predicted double-glycine peptidase|nr:C39 family peptidase [Ktedonobacteraceae bacterium]